MLINNTSHGLIIFTKILNKARLRINKYIYGSYYNTEIVTDLNTSRFDNVYWEVDIKHVLSGTKKREHFDIMLVCNW